MRTKASTWQWLSLLCCMLWMAAANIAEAAPQGELQLLGGRSFQQLTRGSIQLRLGATSTFGDWRRQSHLSATSAAYPTSARQTKRSAFATTRQPLVSNTDLLTAAMIVLIPTVAIELTLFIGNLAAFSVNKRLLAWGIQGMAFSLLGGAVTLPWIILGIHEGLAVSFIALHVALLGISIANIVLGLQDRQRKQKVTLMPWGHVSPQGVAQGGLACVGVF